MGNRVIIFLAVALAGALYFFTRPAQAAPEPQIMTVEYTVS
jgi:hypothetical protein